MAVLVPALRLDTMRRPNNVVGADCTQSNSSLEASQLCQAPEANMGELSYCKHPKLKLNVVYKRGHNATLGGYVPITPCLKGVLTWVSTSVEIPAPCSAVQSCCRGPAELKTHGFAGDALLALTFIFIVQNQ